MRSLTRNEVSQVFGILENLRVFLHREGTTLEEYESFKIKNYQDVVTAWSSVQDCMSELELAPFTEE